LLTLFLHEMELRATAAAEGLAESFAMPRDATSLEELERIIGVLVARDNRWRLYADLAQRAELDLPAPELWMLVRLGEREPTTLAAISAELGIAESDLRPPLNALCDRGVAVSDADEVALTALGKAMRDRALAARQRGLADMLARWQPEQHPDVLALIGGLAQTLAKDLPIPHHGERRAAR
jgi:DNA-binding MarR family transcriptional regulator